MRHRKIQTLTIRARDPRRRQRRGAVAAQVAIETCKARVEAVIQQLSGKQSIALVD
jgi:hypothetical protein